MSVTSSNSVCRCGTSYSMLKQYDFKGFLFIIMGKPTICNEFNGVIAKGM